MFAAVLSEKRAFTRKAGIFLRAREKSILGQTSVSRTTKALGRRVWRALATIQGMSQG
ncbi:hypothetical protein MASR2M17_13360 [Aminivibrio sp.]